MVPLGFIQQIAQSLHGQCALHAGQHAGFVDGGIESGRKDAIPVPFIAQRMDALVAVCVR
jgi:hypothetical protein